MDDLEQLINWMWWIALGICLIHIAMIEITIRSKTATRGSLIARAIACLSIATVLIGFDLTAALVAWNISFLSFIYATVAEKRHGS